MTNNLRRLTSKQEAFARGVAIEKLSLSDAYRVAYDTAKMQPQTVNNEAKKLAAHPLIAARVELLSERAVTATVKKASLTLEASMAEAGELLEDAQTLGQISAGVAAAALRAKLSGLLVEKQPEKKNPLDDIEVGKLLAMRDEIDARLQCEADALDMAGIAPTPPAAVPMRRVIN